MKRWLLVPAVGLSAAIAVGQSVSVPPAPGGSIDIPSAPAGEAHREKVRSSISRGIAYLISMQRTSGAFYEGKAKNQNALTSLAVMAMLSVGHQPADQTPEGEAIRKGLAFVLRPSQQDSDGYFGAADHSRMYGHGITTLMLTEVLGMGVSDEQDAAIRAKCEKAIGLILRAQKAPKREASDAGGWRYSPQSNDSDLSVTGWQLMALRSAKNDGFLVPDEAINDAVTYIKRAYNGSRPARAIDTFSYRIGDNKSPFSITGVGILSLALCGEQDSAEVRGAAKWLAPIQASPTEKWFFYGTYYFAQAMNQMKGEAASLGQQKVDESLLALQADTGSWGQANQYETQNAGRVYCTAMAVLGLGVRYHYLPLYQR